MTARKLVGSRVRWSAGLALMLGCSATGNTDPSTETTDDALGRNVSHRVAPSLRGPGHGHGSGHFPGHFPGHHHPGHGPGAGGSGTGGTSSSGGGRAGSSSAGQSNGSGAAAGMAGTFTGSGGMGTAGTGSIDPGVCGDGTVSGYEECDDGNATSGDGCDAGCMVEPGFTCPYGEPCRAVACGDGITDSYPVGDGIWDYEQCDDGNTTNGDGCSATCDPEPGFYCFAPGQACKAVVCGDGATDPYFVIMEGTGGSTGSAGFAGSGSTGPYYYYAYEACDDGNTTSGDGCNATCEPESGWICDQPGQPCRQPRCGDGNVDFVPGRDGSGGSGGFAGTSGVQDGAAGFAGAVSGSYEQCDDANVASGDGCSDACFIESGYSCPWNGGPCKLAVCGDGIVDYPVEDCDDGAGPSTGCTSTCHYDFGSAGSGSSGTTGVAGSFTAGTGSGVAGSPAEGGRSARGG